MKVRFFGKEAIIKKELVLPIVSGLILAGVLAGCFLSGASGGVIIEDGQAALRQQPETSENDTALRDTGVPGGAPVGHGNTPGAVDEAGEGDHREGGGAAGAAGGAKATGGQADGSAGNTDEIRVYVVGCVKKPGIVTLTKGQMISDAVREAGGLTEDADADNINMVYTLNENVMLYIKSKGESKAVGEGAVVRSDSGPAAEVIAGRDNDAYGRDGIRPVNINTAGVAELDTLPGIGEATARDIIAYREKHGGFSSIEDIMKVPGIKKNRFESIRDYITVE